MNHMNIWYISIRHINAYICLNKCDMTYIYSKCMLIMCTRIDRCTNDYTTNHALSGAGISVRSKESSAKTKEECAKKNI